MPPTWQANRAGLPLRAGWTLSLVLIVALGAGLVRGIGGTTQSQAGVPDQSAPQEPATAAAFIASQRDRDIETASRVTSPLYHAEMIRRGRGTDWPLDGLWVAATPVLDFTFVGAVNDFFGITYALYTARPKHLSGSESPTSLWRIDLDPHGLVVWGELARVFDSPRVDVIRGQRAGSLADGRWPIVLGVRSAMGDAYVALLPDPEDVGRIAFAQEDSSGGLAPSYWSFGQASPTRDAQLHPVDSRPIDADGLSVEEFEMLGSYLRDLGWSPTEPVMPR